MIKMDFNFLEPLKNAGFRKLECSSDGMKIIGFNLITEPRELEQLIWGELELRSEIYVTLGSDLLTYGLEKLIKFVKERSGRTEESVKSTLKYDIIRIRPEYMPDEEEKVKELYFNKVNAPVKKFVDAIGTRVKRGKELLEDTDHFVRSETRDVAAKEIVNRLKKTSSDFGFDLDRITRRTDDLFGRIINVLGDSTSPKFKVQEYQAEIRKKHVRPPDDNKPQLIITQNENSLQIIGGSEIDSNFDNISIGLLKDTLQMYLLAKPPKKAKSE